MFGFISNFCFQRLLNFQTADIVYAFVACVTNEYMKTQSHTLRDLQIKAKLSSYRKLTLICAHGYVVNHKASLYLRRRESNCLPHATEAAVPRNGH
jgi:hypothetical protein